MKRLVFVTVAFLVGCSGMGSGASRFLPASPSGADVRPGERTRVHLTMTVPKRHRRERNREFDPSTISSQTQSVSITVNGGGAQIFNATPSSPACKAGASGTVCTFGVDAPVGSDKFVIATYSSVGGGGTKLDQGSAVFNVVKGKNNAPSIRLGPVVTNTADTGPGSLRYAIGAASPGDTIVLLLSPSSTITLSSPITISNRLSIAGPGVSVSARRRGARPHATYAGVKISGGGTQQILAIQAGATVTISGLILMDGNGSTSSGGAINNKGTLTLVGDVFTGNTSTLQGPLAIRAPRPARAHKHASHGGVRHPHCSSVYQFGGAIYNDATLTVSGTTFDGNTEVSNFASCIYGYGAAIFNDTSGVLFSSKNTYTNNSAYEGGAIYNDSTYGQASFSGDSFVANTGCTADSGCPTSGCTSSCTSAAEGYGAAIADGGGPGITVTNCTFDANVAGGTTADSYGEGGALYLVVGAVTITGSTFSSNLAGGGTTNESEGEAGAIYWDGSAAGLRLTSDTFTGNRAGGDEYGEGGAIVAYAPLNGTGDKFTANSAFGSGSVQYQNGSADGGAIYEDADIVMTGTTFSGNTATAAYEPFGGAIYDAAAANLSSNTFTSNSAIATGANGAQTYAYGGAIYNSDGLTINKNTFTSNKASIAGALAVDAYGGAIYGTAATTSFGDSFISNTAIATTGASANVYGGAIANGSGAMSLNDDVFTSNAATSTSYAAGGAVYSDFIGSSISNGTFTSNTSTGTYAYGGAIYDEGGLTLSGSTVSKSKASTSGGGFYGSHADTIAGATFTANSVVSAPEYGGGGAIYGDGVLTITNSTISGNSVAIAGAYAGGGGIYNNDGVTASGVTISGNAVTGSGTGSGGGGVFSFDSVAMLNSTIAGNHSSLDGGGYMTYGTYSNALTNVTIFQNVASGSGGNINNPYTMTLANDIVAGGTAPTGPDIANSGTITSGDYNIIQTAVAGTPLTGTTTHNLAVNPLLLALTNNGGPTFTNADQSSSPGRAYIPFSGGTCNGAAGTNIDQRGFTRGAGGHCDVGAFELSGLPSAIRQHVTVVHGHHGHAHQHRHHAPPAGATR